MKTAALPGTALLLCVSCLLPLPAPARSSLVLLTLIAATPLALAPFWSGRLPRDPADIAGKPWLLLPAIVLLSSLIPLVLTALGLLGAPLPALASAALVSPGASAIAGLVLLARRRNPPPQAPGPAGGMPPVAVNDRRSATAWLPALAPALIVVGLALRFGTPMGPSDDSFDHIATLRHIMETNRVAFPGAYYAVDPPRGQDPRKGALLTTLAVAGRVSGADPVRVWRGAAVVLGPLMVLVFACLAFELFRRGFPAVLAALALPVLWGDPFWLLRGAYGGHWGLAMAWAGTAMLLGGGGLAWGIAAGVATAAVHAYAPFQLLAPLVLLYAGSRLVPRMPRFVSGAALLGVVAGAVPLEIARKILAGSSGNPLHAQSMGWLLTGAGPVASPLQLLAWLGYPGALALLVVLVLAPLERSRAGLFLLGAAVAPLLLLLNPWLYARAGEWLGSVGNKLVLVWAHPLAVGWLGLLIVSRKRRARALPVLAGAALALVIGPAVPARLDAWRAGPPPLPDDLARGLEEIRRDVPRDGVVAADPLSSYAIPALTGRRTIVTLHQHAPPSDERAPSRLEIVSELFSTCIPLDRALDEVRAEGAGYLLVRGRHAARIDQFGYHEDPRNDAALVRRFAERPDLLERTTPATPDGAPVLYRLRDAPPARADAGQTAVDGAVFPPGGSQPAGPVVSDGTVTFAIQSLPLASRRRGDVLRLAAAWRLDRPVTGYLEYSGHIRFENEALPVAQFPMSLISKPFRRLVLEPRAGGSYRWRAVELPFRGLCPVAAWPAGRWIEDTLEVRVPERLLPGRYSLRAGLERGTLYPILTPADLFQDTDRYSGPTAGFLEIE